MGHQSAFDFDGLATEAVERTAALAREICEIPAPTGDEMQRAHFVAARMRQAGLDPTIDEIGNVVARRPGGQAPSLLLAAHIDTVFPSATDLTVTRDGARLYGPGIGDNCVAVAAMIVLAELLDRAELVTAGDLLLAATVGEEGLGNLCGIRAVVDEYESELGGMLAVEGHELGRVDHTAVGSRRIRVSVNCTGGHSWKVFGQPSAIHTLGTIIHKIAQIQPPTEPKATYNVGTITGGESINTIAAGATASIDMRSTDPAALAGLAEQIEGLIRQQQRDGVAIDIEVLGERPAGSAGGDAPMVRAAMDVLTSLGLEPRAGAASSDANVPIARGIPALCIGMTEGSKMHSVEESIEIPPIRLGLLQLLRVVERYPFDRLS